MKAIQRELSQQIKKASQTFSAVVLSGPRRVGKTFLLQKLFPKASYYLLEDPDTLTRIKTDPRSWLEEISLPAIIDEIQNAPELLPYIRTQIDHHPRKKGQWLLTGSQEFSLMKGVSESMAGRAALFNLLPFSFREVGVWNLLRGFFPEVMAHPSTAQTWFRSYLQTYLERDVRQLIAVKDLTTFRRFLAFLAGRHGQLLNKTALAAPLGVSIPTITQWLSVLETTGHILLIPPYFENFEKRLLKSPKLYWVDSGLLCFLLGIETNQQLERSAFVGSIFEGFLAAEIIKNQINTGRPKELYYFRDEQGLEVDFLFPSSKGGLTLAEVKWSRTPLPAMTNSLQKLLKQIKTKETQAFLVYRPSRQKGSLRAIQPGIQALDVEKFLVEI